MVRQLAGFTVVFSPETGPKDKRAGPVSAQTAAGNLAIVRAGWNAALLDELGDFPVGTKDDQVDALSRAFGELIEGGAPAHMVSVPFLAR
jgi:predicted phage terminase large subunit-like protein